MAQWASRRSSKRSLIRRRTTVSLVAVVVLVVGALAWKPVQRGVTCALLKKDIDNAYDDLDRYEADGDVGGVASAKRDLDHRFIPYKDEGCGTVPAKFSTE
jgi:hypothetical protein